MATIRINGKGKGKSNTNFDTSRQPIEIDSGKGSKGLGIFLIVFSLFWGGMPTFILVSSIFNGTFKPQMLPMLLFAVIGIGLFVGGFAALFYRKKVVINDNRVKISIKSIFGNKEFNEHINSYKGIRNYSEYHSGGKNSPSYTLYINEILHISNKKLNIKLDVQRDSSSGMRTLWENHCRNLNLAALSGELGSETVRKVEDLDKNVKTLMEEGKIEADFDPRDKPPQGFKLTIEDGKLKIVMKDRPGIYIGMAFMLVFASLFAYLLVFKDGVRWSVMFPMMIIAVFIIIPILITIYHIFTHGCIFLTSDSVVNCRIKLNGDVASKNPKIMKYSQIETISVGKIENDSSMGLVLKSDNENLHIAKGQKKESLEWLRNCILSSIAR